VSRAAPLLGALVLSTCAACNVQRPLDTGSIDAGSPAPNVVRTVPDDGETDVPVNQPVDIYLDGVPNPDIIGPKSIVVLSGHYYWLGTVDVDLVRRRVRFRATNGLYPDTGYLVTVSRGVGTLSDPQEPRPQIFRFRTGEGTVAQPPPPGLTLSGDVEPIFTGTTTDGQPRCTNASCHDATGAGVGLDLSSPRAAMADLVGQPATEAPALSRVAPGDAPDSFLLRKLLGVHPAYAHVLSPAAEPTQADLLVIEDWIAGGAQP
jgi:hypothetical protein